MSENQRRMADVLTARDLVLRGLMTIILIAGALAALLALQTG